MGRCTEDQNGWRNTRAVVVATKPEGVREGHVKLGRACRVRHVIQVALGVGNFLVDRGRQDLIADSEQAGNRLDGTGGRHGVTEHGLDRADRHAVRAFAQQGLNRQRLDPVVHLGRSPVCIDVIHRTGIEAG